MPTGNTSHHKLRLTYASLLALALAFTLYEELHLRRWLFQHYGHNSVIAGSLPNFLAVILFGLAMVLIKLPDSNRKTIQPIAAVVIGLILYEIAQIWMPHRVFDWNDIAATVLGGIACSVLAIIPRFNAFP